MSGRYDPSDGEPSFVPAVLKRPKVANHIVHESFTIDTHDHEDHTFCGVMFDVRCRDSGVGGSAPLQFMEIHGISIRGSLGPLTVWTTPTSYRGKEHDEAMWELIFERCLPSSHRDYQRLEFDKPIRLAAGEGCGLYVHSKLPGDTAIVYDNQHSELTYVDEVFQVFPGLAHLSNRPFGRRGMWGFPWRENREFVGLFHYGVSYTLWNPEVHQKFSRDFRNAVKACLLCARRPESPLNRLQDDVVFFILNMCKYDWFSRGSQRTSADVHRGLAPTRNSGLLFTPSTACAGRQFLTRAGLQARCQLRVPPETLPSLPRGGMDIPDTSSDSDSADDRNIQHASAALHLSGYPSRGASGSAPSVEGDEKV